LRDQTHSVTCFATSRHGPLCSGGKTAPAQTSPA
jgi:hypothetical protein